jgi:hypothetical protein
MNAKILTAVLVIIASGAYENKVQAQSPPTQNSNTSEVTLSGDSLTGIETRTAQEDYLGFFSQNNSANASRNSVNYMDPTREVWQISSDVELQVNRRLSPPTSPILNPRPDQFDGVDRVEIQVEVAE